MKKLCTIILIELLICGILFQNCDIHNNNNVEYCFSVTDSTGVEQIEFKPDEDIVFHFSIINDGHRTIPYTRCDSGPIVSFVVQTIDSTVGYSDDGYSYMQVVLRGILEPGDTISNSVSWYSNSYHDSLDVGNYRVKVVPNIQMLDISPLYYLDSKEFQIIDN